MSTSEPIIRLAELRDREGLHAAHMRSIREICVRDHGLEEIKGWGYRELGERWVEGIDKGFVWVVELRGRIEGVGAIAVRPDQKIGHIHAMYLTPEVVGTGLGRRLMTTVLDRLGALGVDTVTLDSTITAHEFYKKFGFEDCGPARQSPIGGSLVTSFPMRLVLVKQSAKGST